MNKFLKLSFILVALALGMVSCSDDDSDQPDVVPVLPGTVPAPEFTGIDATAKANFADGLVTATLVDVENYLRVRIAGSSPEKPRYAWRMGTNNHATVYIKGGKLYVGFYSYALAYIKKNNPDAMGALQDLDFYYRRSYRDTQTSYPGILCASDFKFGNLPLAQIAFTDIDVVELNDKRMAYSIVNKEDSDITTFCVFEISRGMDVENTLMVDTPEQGMRLMLDRCYNVLCVQDEGYKPFIDEIAQKLGLK